MLRPYLETLGDVNAFLDRLRAEMEDAIHKGERIEIRYNTIRTELDVHCVCCTSVLPWERRAPARLQKPRWSVAFPGKAVENWQWMYATGI